MWLLISLATHAPNTPLAATPLAKHGCWGWLQAALRQCKPHDVSAWDRGPRSIFRDTQHPAAAELHTPGAGVPADVHPFAANTGQQTLVPPSLSPHTVDSTALRRGAPAAGMQPELLLEHVSPPPPPGCSEVLLLDMLSTNTTGATHRNPALAHGRVQHTTPQGQWQAPIQLASPPRNMSLTPVGAILLRGTMPAVAPSCLALEFLLRYSAPPSSCFATATPCQGYGTCPAQTCPPRMLSRPEPHGPLPTVQRRPCR